MNKKIGMLMIALFIATSFTANLFASDKGNGRKGKYLFRKHCRSCHIENGEATALSPISKTQAAWTNIFKKDVYGKLKCSAEWDKRKEKDLLDIYTYMHDHAFDSPSPLKCK